MDGSPLSIRYFDFSSCFPIFARRLEFLPALAEVRLGADVPPEYRNVCRKHQKDVRTPTREMCHLLQGLGVLSQLNNLVLKDFSNTELEAALSSCGWRLERLEVHYMTTGVDLSLIDRLCPRLTNLNISNSRVFQSNKTQTFLPKLCQCRLMRVSYEERTDTENIFLSQCGALRILHQEAGPATNDQFIDSLLSGPGHSLQALGRLESCYYFSSHPSCRGTGPDWRLSPHLSVSPQVGGAAPAN